MRGSPLLRALLALAALLALGVPLWRITHATAAQRSAPVINDSAAAGIRLQLAFTSIPTSVKVLHLGHEIWNESSPAAELERQVSLPFPTEGIDLEFQITWGSDTLSAARVTLTDPVGETHERAVWGRGEVTEVLTFP